MVSEKTKNKTEMVIFISRVKKSQDFVSRQNCFLNIVFLNQLHHGQKIIITT